MFSQIRLCTMPYVKSKALIQATFYKTGNIRISQWPSFREFRYIFFLENYLLQFTQRTFDTYLNHFCESRHHLKYLVLSLSPCLLTYHVSNFTEKISYNLDICVEPKIHRQKTARNPKKNFVLIYLRLTRGVSKTRFSTLLHPDTKYCKVANSTLLVY